MWVTLVKKNFGPNQVWVDPTRVVAIYATEQSPGVVILDLPSAGSVAPSLWNFNGYLYLECAEEATALSEMRLMEMEYSD